MADKPKYEITLKDVRLSYEHLWKPYASEGDTATGKAPKFSATLLLDKKTHAEQIKAVKALIVKCRADKWGDKARSVNTICIKDGSLKEGTDGYGEHIEFISASSDRKPQIFEGAVSAGETKVSTGKIFSGCYVNAVIRVWAQDNKFGKKVNAEICVVQYKRDGEAFGGGSADTSALDGADEVAGDEDLGLGDLS